MLTFWLCRSDLEVSKLNSVILKVTNFQEEEDNTCKTSRDDNIPL